MKIYFNSLGVLTSANTTGDTLRQGAVGIALKAFFDDIDNGDYIAKFNFTRSDGTKITNVTMTLNSINLEEYDYTFDDEWYFAKAGTTTLTIFLRDASQNVVASGQYQFTIEENDYDEDPETITEEQYDSLVDYINTGFVKVTGDQDVGGSKNFTSDVTIDKKKLIINDSLSTGAKAELSVENALVKLKSIYQSAETTISWSRANQKVTIDNADISYSNVTTAQTFNLPATGGTFATQEYVTSNAAGHLGTLDINITVGQLRALMTENKLYSFVFNSNLYIGYVGTLASQTALSILKVATGDGFLKRWQLYYGGNHDSELLTSVLSTSSSYYKPLATENYVDTQDALKADKITEGSRLYATDSSGNPATVYYGAGAIAGRVPVRVEGGNINVGTPTNDAHAASKKYVDDGFVSKTSYANKVYGTDENGEQHIFNVLHNVTPGFGTNTIPLRNDYGSIKTPNPSDNYDAANKIYVDTKVNEAVATAYKPKGSVATVADLPTTGNTIGDVYNVLDTGANYVWAEIEGVLQWDKLGETINWNEYNETFMAAGFIQAGPIDSVPDELTFDSEGNITNDDWTGNIEIDYMSPPISDISISQVPATLHFDTTQDYDNMITDADWTGIMTITY